MKLEWKKPEDVSKWLCTHCLHGLVETVVGTHPHDTTHWQCDNCDSTYDYTDYPMTLGETLDLWNAYTCDNCNYIGTEVTNGLCQNCQ